MKLRRIHLASATALGVLAFAGFSSQAHAGAFAFADLEVTNFEIDGSGGILTNNNPATGGTAGGTVNVTSVVDSFSTTATLTGSPGVVGSSNPSNICTGSAAGCGATAGAPFTFVSPPLNNGSFSQAADSLTGSPVAGVNPNTPPSGPNLTTPAFAKTAAQNQILGTGLANATSTLGLTSGFNFTLIGTAGGTTALTLKFDGFNNLIAGLDATGISAQASSALSFTITDNTTHAQLLSWAPNGMGTVTCTAATNCVVVDDPANLNTNAGSTTHNFTDTVTNSSPQLFELTFTLPNDDPLTLTINHTVQAFEANVAPVPEPGSLALLATGLLGLGAFVRRRRRS